MLLSDLVATSTAVAATPARTEKVRLIGDLLTRAPAELVGLTVTWLGGSLRQRRTGVGWRSLTELPAPAAEPTLRLLDVDEAFETMAGLSGPGSQGVRTGVLRDLLSSATEREQEWLRRLVLGELRQGALDSVVQSAVARVAGVKVAQVQRAAMMAGSTAPVAAAALASGSAAEAEAALAEFRLRVGRPVLPMLAASAAEVGEGIDKVLRADASEVVVDAKLDGIRLQVHRRRGEVLVVTRSLDDITSRLPEVVEMVRQLPGGDLVLDGEGLVLAPDGQPVTFQETASRTGSAVDPTQTGARVTPFFFDLLHADGQDLVNEPLTRRLGRLDQIIPPEHRTRRLTTSDRSAAEAFTRDVLAAGHEGVVLKDPESPYQAGRRGASWVKVKPVHTLDLVVLAVEHGSGRRHRWLSNIHLGARDPETGGFVMVGKTFKGMTDEMLAWQTERFRDLQVGEDDWTVWVRPEQVVEIALDGVQRSTRYPGGVALRFARVVRYRDDKSAADADTIESVLALRLQR